jgi:hypothetical protein
VSNSTSVNATMVDIALALTESINKDGTKAWTANQSLGGFKFTSVGDGSARTDSTALGQVQDGKANWVVASGTADALTATYAPAITALGDGQLCFVRAGFANATTTPTFAPNGLTARTIVKQGGSALVAGDIAAADAEIILRYKLASTRWELLNPKAAATTAATAVEQMTGTSNTVFSTPLSTAPLWKKGANVASAGTTTFLDDGGFVHITGTTTITDLDFTTATDGHGIKVIFDGILTLTHNGTTLKLPGNLNITTAAGDRAEFVQDSSDNIICLWYTKADGKAVVASGQILETQTASASASIIFDLSQYTQYTHFRVLATGIVPATDATDFEMHVSTDGGSTYDAGASNYSWVVLGYTSTLVTPLSNADTKITVNVTPLGNVAGEYLNFDMLIVAPAAAARHGFQWQVSGKNSTPHVFTGTGGGQRNAAQDTTHVRYRCLAGNITSGTFALIGVS